MKSYESSFKSSVKNSNDRNVENKSDSTLNLSNCDKNYYVSTKIDNKTMKYKFNDLEENQRYFNHNVLNKSKLGQPKEYKKIVNQIIEGNNTLDNLKKV